jgi:MGT family glycosyltransferase
MSKRFLFTTWSGGGAVPPATSIARALRERGHEVRVLGDRSVHEEIAAAGVEPIAWTTAPEGDVSDPDRDIVKDFEARTPLGGFARMRDRLVCGPAAGYARDTAAELQRRPADVVAADCMLLGTHIAAEAAGVPLASLVHTIYPFPGEGAPPFGPGLPPARGALGRLRDRALAAVVIKPWEKGLAPLNAARAAHGLTPLSGVVDALLAPDRMLVLSPRALDYAGRRYPEHVRFVGPRLDDPSWAGEVSLPQGDDQLVLVGLSSTFQDQRATLERIAAALGTLPVRGLLTTGPAIDPATLAAPPNVRVERSAPHGAVLPHVSVTVTHAGHGTVVKSLAAGVPLVCVPMGRDQNEIARRVQVAGAGVTVRPGASSRAIAAAIRRVLRDPSYRRAAGRLADAIASETETDRAVAELEDMADRASASAASNTRLRAATSATG